MREVANFMYMYPAYKLRDVMEEYAITFFTLLNEGYRIRHQDYRMRASIALLPHVDKSAREAWFRDIELAADGFDAILNREQGSSAEELKRMMG